jgi:hypothetical protein
MLYTLYNIIYIYRIILQLHGYYVAYSFLCWSLGYTYTLITYFISFFYTDNNIEIKQIKDKKK